MTLSSASECRLPNSSLERTPSEQATEPNEATNTDTQSHHQDILVRSQNDPVSCPDGPSEIGASLYAPLQGQDIRLISVERSRDDGVLRCKLICAPLTEHLNFHALSYVWGDPANKQTILVNDQPFEVTQNLYNFLNQVWKDEHLFRRDRPSTHDGEDTGLVSTEPLYWWTDAICINQEDIDEKSIQVPRMGELYSMASRVWVWLGNPESIFPRAPGLAMLKLALSNEFIMKLHEDDSVPLAVRLSRAATRRASREVTDMIIKQMKQDRAKSPEDHIEIPEAEVVLEAVMAGLSENDIREAADLPPIPRGTVSLQALPEAADSLLQWLLKQLDALMSNPWFDRTWIIQEFVLSKNPPIALIGDFSFFFSYLYQLIVHMAAQRTNMERTTQSMVQSLFPKFGKMFNLFTALNWRKDISIDVRGFPLLSPGHKLLHLLRVFAKKQSTVPHDHVYGMLGLLDTQLPEDLIPNYRLPFEKVCQAYAKYMLECTGDLKVIEAHSSDLGSCPGWVPDLRYMDNIRNLQSRSVISTVTFSEDSNRLVVDGTRIGQVLGCSCTLGRTPDTVGHLRFINDVILTGMAWITQQSLDDVFHTWLSTILEAQFLLPQSIVADIRTMDELIAKYQVLCRSIPKDVVAILPTLPTSAFTNFYDTDCANPELLHAVLSVASLKHCVLASGETAVCQLKFIDAKHRHDLNDCVWALKGCQNVSILRPENGGYRYVGHCLTFKPGQTFDAMVKQLETGQDEGTLKYHLNERFFAERVVQKVTLV
ncbi:hypothetical protein OPT61_g2479 [Boeremia exigua]|uniref:Uncharacterized protein n=1 Tax=Boeremia exigua TaxID=749465 RepID=A0ACC2ILC3_9PLEO|nr:hypothetical protein OPT61_g2479 [Boeremia exigua]